MTTSGKIKKLLCDADDAAEYLNTDIRTLIALVENNKIPAFQIDYGHWIFVIEEIKEWKKNYDIESNIEIQLIRKKI